jgi:hypothetical protein
MTKLPLLLTGLLFAGCATDPGDVLVAAGPWGGTNVELQVSDRGASALFKCGALGTVDEPLALDGGGRFDAVGTYDPKLVLGGPRPARYRGTVSGTTMTLRLEVGGVGIGPYSLTEGSGGSFEVCNY